MRQSPKPPAKPSPPRRVSLWRRLSRPQRTLALIIVAYVALFFPLAVRCYDVFGYDSGGTAVFNNMMWWTIHGKPFFIASLVSDQATKPLSNLAYHAAYFWAFLVPFYALAPRPETLMLLQSLALGLAAVPMYLVARKVLQDEWASVLLATAFIFLPPVVSQNLNQVMKPSFLPVFLIFAFYFFIERKFGLFMLLAALSSMNRENVPLAISMFGVWALVERRSWKWIVTPAVFGAVYFWFVTFIAMPYFRQGEPWHVARMFGYLGANQNEIFKNAVLHPGLLLSHLLGPDKIEYLVQLTQPMGWILPFLSPASLVALPDLILNLLSVNTALRVIGWHYNMTTGTALFVSCIFGLRKLDQWLQRLIGGGPHRIVLAGTFVALSIAHWFLWFNPSILHELPYHDTLVRAIQLIPSKASVVGSSRIVGELSTRPHFDQYGVFSYNPELAKKYEYVLLDANERRFPPLVTQEVFDSFYKNAAYHLIFAENNVFVFQRVDGQPGFSE